MKLLRCLKHFAGLTGRRWKSRLLPLVILALVTACWLLAASPCDHNFQHFKHSRDLQHYFDAIKLVIEPPPPACTSKVSLLVLVTSAPSHAAQRQAIRDSWGQHLVTYFVLGVEQNTSSRNTVANDAEARQHGDLIVYDMLDHYQNLTLKTMLMLKWTQERCPEAQYMYKTDDDIFVNPWTLKAVVKKNHGAKMIGHLLSNISVPRADKYFIPRWLLAQDVIPEYLAGSGYLVQVEALDEIISAAKKVPLINIEDIYLTYLVCKAGLGMDLVDDRRMEKRLILYGRLRPWLPAACDYWRLASALTFNPSEMAQAWSALKKIGNKFEQGVEVCTSSENILYRIIERLDLWILRMQG